MSLELMNFIKSVLFGGGGGAGGDNNNNRNNNNQQQELEDNQGQEDSTMSSTTPSTTGDNGTGDNGNIEMMEVGSAPSSPPPPPPCPGPEGDGGNINDDTSNVDDDSVNNNKDEEEEDEGMVSAEDDEDLEEYEEEDEEGDDNCEGCFEDPQKGREDTEGDMVQYAIVKTEDVERDMMEMIQEVNSVLQLRTTTVRNLLHHFNWQKERLLEAYYDGNQESLFKSANIMQHIPSQKPLISPSKMLGEECLICFANCPTQGMFQLECSHRFCKDCWVNYLTSKIMDDGMGGSVNCPSYKCDVQMDDQTVLELVTDPHVKAKYRKQTVKSFVESNKLMRWCPGVDCQNVIRAEWPQWFPARCNCGFTCCFLCGRDWHDIVGCDMLQRWEKKCIDDSETANWIVAHTKNCPKCGAIIEKNGGCNHMTCRNSGCRNEFCWVCLGPWARHQTNSCNRYDSSTEEAQNKAKQILKRYLFHFTRYKNHKHSLELQKKLLATVTSQMEHMQRIKVLSFAEVQFMKKAMDILCQCRRILAYTYVFAFYLEKNNETDMFILNQSNLETATELLAEYLEKEITHENIQEVKQLVLDKSAYCNERQKVLVAQVHEGYEKDSWIFTNVPS